MAEIEKSVISSPCVPMSSNIKGDDEILDEVARAAIALVAISERVGATGATGAAEEEAVVLIRGNNVSDSLVNCDLFVVLNLRSRPVLQFHRA